MQIHVLAGFRKFLRPKILTPEEAGGLIDPIVRAPRAYWIGRGVGDEYHDFLQEEAGDQRIEVMAEALNDEFGTRFQPLLVLADLLDESDGDPTDTSGQGEGEQRSQFDVLSGILRCGYTSTVELYALALPRVNESEEPWIESDGIDAGSARDGLSRLRKSIVEEFDQIAVSTNLVEVTPETPFFYILYNNALASHLARRLSEPVADCGLLPQADLLAAAIADVLSDWNSRGLMARSPIGSKELDTMSNRVYEVLLQR